MAKTRPKVFLDANIIIRAGKPPGGPIMARIKDLVKANLIDLLTTDLTITEVAKKHAENDYEIIKEVGRPHFRKVVSDHLGTGLPEISKAELEASISAIYATRVASMFKNLRARTLAIDNVKPSIVFASYAKGDGFFTGEGKKNQFPDAFIFECLKAEASAKSPVIIVSDDGDFDLPIMGTEHISLIATVPELFQKLGLQEKAPNIEQFLQENEKELINLVQEELCQWSLEASDVEEAEIEVSTVTNLQLSDLVSFGSIKTGGNILVVGTAEITATISYTHPNWAEAMYDSEDKVLVPFENVSGETEVTVNADFSTSILVDDQGEPSQIEEFQFRNGDFIYVELYPYDSYR